MYHRVTDLRSDPWSLAVSPKNFAEQLEVLRRQCQPIGLKQLVTALCTGHLPRRAAVVTFDDGYADNLYAGNTLLERYEVPATIFITSGAIGSKREFWWDELDRVILQPDSLPQILRLTINRRTYDWDLGPPADYDEEATRQHRSWRAAEAAPSPRHAVYQSLCTLLRVLPGAEQEAVLAQLQAWSGVEPAIRPTHRSLTADELVTLAQGRLMEIGAHTVTHPTLAAFPAALQRQEIEQSKAFLDNLLGQPVTSFAYPFGSRDAYTAETIQAVRAAGFASACTTAGATVRPSSDVYQLPRIYAPDCDGDHFAKLLSRWMLQ